ncbi:MAG: nucleotide exchange factor GrpE [Lentisphaerae bacterium]|jgi:molecular chaperone GrpE|nr:nucleotide exchange factor GrpE [Lentisphaerota bacterium]
MFESKNKKEMVDEMTTQAKETTEQDNLHDNQPAPDESAEAETAATADAPPEAPPADNNGEDNTWRDRYTRLMADFDNYRKRQIREREEFVKRANEALISELLPVVDNLELALSAATIIDDPFVTGVRIVAEQFTAALAKAGVTPIDATGLPFSHDLHEALGQIPSETVPAGDVAIQLRKGWLIADRLLRPAQVMVSSGPLADEAQPDAATPETPSPAERDTCETE